jgi:hypothetical protein
MAAITTERFHTRVTTGTVGGRFEYFTGPKHVWNLGVCATLNNGGAIDEVDRACRPAREAADVEFYEQVLDAFAKVFEIGDPAASRVEVPFEGATAPAYFSNASRDDEPVPCVVMWTGLDSTKDHTYEATALGNVLVQGRALGALSGTLDALRALVARTQRIVVHEPHGVAR